MPDTEWGEIVDPTEQVSTPSEAAAKLAAIPPAVAKGGAQAAEHPLSTVASLGRFIKRNAIPAGAMGAAGLATDLLLPEGGIPLTIARMLARSAASGAANVATTKKLPPSLGGEPSMPAGRAFLYGTMGEPLIEGPGLAEKFAQRRLDKAAEQAAEQGVKTLSPDPLALQSSVLAPKARVPFPNRLGGNELTAATDMARNPVVSTIQAARNKYGAWLANAYGSLKGAEPLTEDQAQNIADDASKVLAERRAPGPQTASFAAQLKKLAPPSEKEAAEQGSSMIRPIELPDGTIVVPGAAKLSPESLKLQGYSDAQIEKLLGKQEPYKPPTLDRLRNLWQQLGTAKAKAEAANNGADANGLGQLRDIVEEQLNDHLGPEWKQQRINYRGHIRRWNYRDQSQLWNLDTPQQVADWAFEKPEYAHDLMTESEGNPAQHRKLQELFLQHVFGPLNDTTMSRAQKLAYVRKALAPYVKDLETARLVMGPRAGKTMSELMSFARFSDDFKDSYTHDPKFREQFQRGIAQEALLNHITPEQAAQKIMAGIAQANPELGSTVGDIVRQLPPPQIGGGPGRLGGFGGRALTYHGSMLAVYGLGALGGHELGFGVAYQLAALAGYLLLSPATVYKGASRLGIVAPIIKAMASKSPNYAGRVFARAFLNTGQRKLQEMDVERNAP